MAEVGIGKFLQERAEQGLLRTLKPNSYRSKGKICYGGKEYVDLSSNDYLGLSEHPKLIAASKNAIDKFGTSSSASRLMSGDLEMYHQLEEKLARFKNKEAALVFNTGYQANIGIISALYDKGDCIFSDRLNHASIIDGMVLSGARVFRFAHNDAGHLKSLLEKERGKFQDALIVSESVFSMDGDKAPLKELVELKDKYHCALMLDEAHATGIFGADGSGLAQAEGVAQRIDLLMGTFSKALGSFGAYLAASKEIVDYLVNTARSFIYSTALPPAVLAANLAGIDIIKEEPWRRERLLEGALYLREGLRDKGFQVIGDSQIVPLVIGENLRALEFAQALQKKGYWVLPVRPPTVPKGQARLRFSLTANHAKETLERLIHDIAEVKV